MRKLFRLLFRLGLFILVIIGGIITVSTLAFSSKQIPVEPVTAPTVDDAVLERLSAAIRIPTVSYDNGVDTLAFRQLDTLIEEGFPLLDSLLERLPLEGFSRVYKWPGTNPKLLPILTAGFGSEVTTRASFILMEKTLPFMLNRTVSAITMYMPSCEIPGDTYGSGPTTMG